MIMDLFWTFKCDNLEKTKPHCVWNLFLLKKNQPWIYKNTVVDMIQEPEHKKNGSSLVDNLGRYIHYVPYIFQ